jgi:DNA-binding NarL/FixJ family response regulator
LGISIPQLQKYERASNKISAVLLYEISRALEIPLERLLQDVNVFCEQALKKEFNILLIQENICQEVFIRKIIDSFPKKINTYIIHEAEKVLEFFSYFDSKDVRKECLKPDLVILELNRSNVSGLEILKEIRRHRFLLSLPVVLLADAVNPKEVESSYALYAAGVILKSCSPSKLKEQIHHVLEYWCNLVMLPKISALTQKRSKRKILKLELTKEGEV